MIVPSRRLLLMTACLAVPLCTAAVLLKDSGAGVCYGLLVLLAVALTIDAYAGIGALRQISVGTGDVLVLVREREEVLHLRVANHGPRRQFVRIAPAFPAGLRSAEKAIVGGIVPPQSETSWEQKVKASARGEMTVDACDMEVASPLALWLVRGRTRVSLAVQVHPNFAKNKIAAAFLRHSQFGLKTYRQVGQGREFEELRDYAPGDSFDQIYWKGTARRASAVSKIFQVERAQECYVLLDCSRNTAAGNTLDYFVEAALVLGLAAQRYGDQFGILTFSDRVHTFQRARAGKAQFSRCRKAIYALQPQPVSADFAELAAFTQARLRKRALLFVLTNLADPYAAESLASHIRLLARKHLVVIGTLRQTGMERMFDGPRPEAVKDIYFALAGHVSWAKLRDFGSRMKMQGAEFVLSSPQTIYADLSNRYEQMRQRQML